MYPSAANFILFRDTAASNSGGRPGSLGEALLARGILIRSCGNFRGLDGSYYRIGLKLPQENNILLDELGQIVAERDQSGTRQGENTQDAQRGGAVSYTHLRIKAFAHHPGSRRHRPGPGPLEPRGEAAGESGSFGENVTVAFFPQVQVGFFSERELVLLPRQKSGGFIGQKILLVRPPHPDLSLIHI